MIRIATLNCYKQTGLDNAKQKQLSDFISRENVDIGLLQEINVDHTTFEDESFISSNFNIYDSFNTVCFSIALVSYVLISFKL